MKLEKFRILAAKLTVLKRVDDSMISHKLALGDTRTDSLARVFIACFPSHSIARKLWILPFGLEKFCILDEFRTGLAPPNGAILTMFGRLVTEKIVLGIYT